MTDHDDAVLTLVRAADPLDVDELERWLASSAPARIHAAATTRPSINHRRRRTAALVVIGVAATSIAAAAATGHLGRPAPDRVKAHIAELDHGLPPDLQANPDLDSARLVAES